MHIAIFIGVFESGGAERVLSIMANFWAQQGHEITLISMSAQRRDWYQLDSFVKRITVNAIGGASKNVLDAIAKNIKRIIALRQAFKQLRPDVVVSFIDTSNIMALIASAGLGFPVIVSERTDPRHHRIGLCWDALRRVLYRRAAAVVVQTSSVHNWACGFLIHEAIHKIPNPINPDLIGFANRASCTGVGRVVLAVGRLGREKGFDLLIEAFSRCAAKHVEWSLVIAGEGPERANLEALISAIGLGDRVRLLGRVKDPFLTIRGVELFVLSSRYEGFPNALLEAMSTRLAVIATDCPSGPKDIIHSEVDGVLVPPEDVDALTLALDRLMRDGAERRRLGEQAIHVVDRFSADKIMKMWNELVASVYTGAEK